jgi:hypothetical protein
LKPFNLEAEYSDQSVHRFLNIQTSLEGKVKFCLASWFIMLTIFAKDILALVKGMIYDFNLLVLSTEA